MDPVTTGAGVMLFAPPLHDFLKRIGGPVADELGELLRDKLLAYRQRNLHRTTTRALQYVESSGRAASAIPPRTLIPLLDAATLEDDPELSDRWAALLANAALAEQEAGLPIVRSVLTQLHPIDAKVLDTIRSINDEGIPPDPDLPVGKVVPERWGARRSDITSRVSLNNERLELSLTTLLSLGLVDNEPAARYIEGDAFLSSGFEFQLSPLGVAFLRACSPPRKQS